MLPSGVWSTLITLSIMLEPLDGVVSARRRAGPGGAPARRPSRGCPRPASSCPSPRRRSRPSTTPSGNRTSMFFRLCCRAPSDDDRRHLGRLSRPGDGCVGTGIAALPLRYWPVSDVASLLDLLGRAAAVISPPTVARAGAEVDQVIGRLDDLAVVLDQDQRVAQVAEVPQRAEQPGVVARVQADRRLVEHVEHAGQAAADLAGQPDALALAAGERRRAAGQASGSRGRRRPGTSGGRGPRGPGRRRCAAGRRSSLSP